MHALGARAASVVWVSIMVAASGCTRLAPPVRPSPLAAAAPAPIPVSPFADTPVSFFVKSPHFTPGELVIVRVCIRPDRSIASADVVESSGDRQFDELAVGWARQIKLRSVATDGPPPLVAPCGPVRVEVHSVLEPRVIVRPDNLLG